MNQTPSVITHENITYNNEIYIKTSYNDISCISTTRNHERYYNLTKVLIDNSYKQDITRITRNKYWIDFIKAIKDEFKYDVLNDKFVLMKNSQTAEIRDLVDSDLCFQIKNVVQYPEINGTYYHELFMNYFCEHVNLNYAIQVSRFMVQINKDNEELRLKNMNLEDKIKELTTPLNRLISNIIKIIHVEDDIYKIYLCKASQSSRETENMKILRYYNADDVYKIFKNTFNEYKELSFGKKISKPYMYQINDYDTCLKCFDEIKNNTFNEENYGVDIDFKVKQLFDYYKDTYDKFVEQKNISKIASTKGKLYEFDILKQLKSLHPNNDIYIWNFIPIRYRNEYNTIRNDIGKDIVDFTDKVIYQCKCYDSDVILSSDLITFMDEIDFYKDNGFKFKLVVPDIAVITSKTITKMKSDTFEIIKLNPTLKLVETTNFKKHVYDNWNLTDDEIYKKYIEKYNKDIKPNYVRRTRYELLKEHSTLISPYRQLTSTPKDICLENWNLTDKEILNLIHDKYNKNYTINGVKHLRYSLLETNNTLISPYQNRDESKQVNTYIKNNPNLTADEIIKNINVLFPNFQLSKQAIYVRKSKQQLSVKARVDKNTSKLINQYIKEHLNLTNKEIADNVNEIYDVHENPFTSEAIRKRRQAILKK